MLKPIINVVKFHSSDYVRCTPCSSSSTSGHASSVQMCPWQPTVRQHWILHLHTYEVESWHSGKPQCSIRFREALWKTKWRGSTRKNSVDSLRGRNKFHDVLYHHVNFRLPINTWDLRCIVKCYLDCQRRIIRQFAHNLQGKERTMSFLKRHRELSIRFASNIKLKRAQVSADMVHEFFSNLADELVSIPPSNIWNYNETNLTLWQLMRSKTTAWRLAHTSK